MLVACAKRLAAQGRRDIHFCIVGDGMSRAQLEADIDSAGVREYFTFEGMQPVERIPAYHTMAGALFAALAKSDDLGLTVPAKITSYMAAGRPVLVAADGEAARAVPSAGCGLACAAGDEEALCRNLVRLADMPAAAPRSKAGRSCFRAHTAAACFCSGCWHASLAVKTPNDGVRF
ncbi:MAG: glycosyltransferase [Ruthenibacterium sp.]